MLELERKLTRARAASPDSEEQVAKEREAATEYMNRWQRTQADFANFKRRVEQEQQQRDALATWRALASVLPALDNFERAFATLPPTLAGYTWLDGIALIHLQLNQALASMGIAPVEAEPGQLLDPTRHQAIGEIETDERGEGRSPSSCNAATRRPVCCCGPRWSRPPARRRVPRRSRKRRVWSVMRASPSRTPPRRARRREYCLIGLIPEKMSQIQPRE